MRRRLAECRNASDVNIADMHCNAEFVMNMERCTQADCELSRWSFTPWSEVCLQDVRRCVQREWKETDLLSVIAIRDIAGGMYRAFVTETS